MTGSDAKNASRVNREWANFNKLWAGQTASQFGNAVTLVALPLLAVEQLGATSFEVGLITSAEFLAYPLLGLVAGVYVDRWSRRRTLLTADAGRAVLTALIPLLAVLALLDVWHVVVFAFAIGVLTLFFDVAHQAYLPQIVSKDKLVAGNSKLVATTSTVRLAGPGAGGLLVSAFGAANALLVDAVSFVANFFAIKSIREIEPSDEDVAAPQERKKVGAELLEGIRYLTADPVLRSFLVSVAIFNLLLTAEQTLWVLFLVRTLDTPATLVGLLFAAGGVGAIIGSASAGRLVARLGTATTLRLGSLVGPVLGLLIPVTGPGFGLLAFAAGSAALSAGGNVFNIVVASYRQATVPARLLGRVVATSRTATWGLLPLGGLVGGVLGEVMGVRPALILLAVGLLASPLWLMVTPAWRVREMPGADEEPAAETREGESDR